MPVKTENELADLQRGHWLKAVAAIELRNFDYAISLLQGLLKQEPEFLTGRQLLRRAEIARRKARKRGFFEVSTAPLSIMKAQREIRNDPKHALEMIEKVLEDEPYNRSANLALKRAAVAAGWPEIGVFALHTLLEDEPGDTRLLHELGRLHHELGESDRAVEIYNRITEIDPSDAEALRLGKDASARASIKTGGWAQAETYRDLMKDKARAVSLEQQNWMASTKESLEQQIEETYLRHQADPGSVDLARRLGVLYEQKEDYDNAIAWYQYAAGIIGGTDSGLTQKVSNLQTRKWEREMAAHEQFLATHDSTDPLFVERSAALAAAKKERAELLVEQAQKCSERNPADLQLHFELGARLVETGRFREAVPELQRARQNPNARLKSMNLLGRCYRALGMLDLAAKQLEEGAREIVSMDAMKKEITYNLGLVYEQMGEAEKSIAAMKQIYQADYGYRDVASRVENSYATKDPPG
jgi:tetratricopeptide (TPR) repeat protein